MESRTRARDAVHMSDVIERSVQQLALEDEAGKSVAGDGWAVVQDSWSGARRRHRVRLLGATEIWEMSERYSDLVYGRVGRPKPSRSLSKCGN
jgi:hypothetical protein